MTHTINNSENDSHWTPASLGFSILLGVVATVGLWLSAGLLLMLFLL